MTDGPDLMERRLDRQTLLKLAAAAGGAGLLAAHESSALAALDRLTAETGRLQVMDWAYYGYDGGQSMFAAYDKKYPKNKPQFTQMANEADAIGKISSGTARATFSTARARP